MCPHQSTAIEGYAPVKNATLFYREVGAGQPIIVLHGGPDFDHSYLLPDLDRLSDLYRLIYYSQRGRGKFGGHVQPAEVSIQSEIDDLESLRTYLHLESMALLGHSWGGLLAMEYAIRHPERVSHMILMNGFPASYADYMVVRQEVSRRRIAYADELNRLLSSDAYKEGEPEAVAVYYRIHFGVAIKQREHLETVLASMKPSFTKESVLQGRAIEDHLYDEIESNGGFDLFPQLQQLHIPTLVIHGDYDFIPASCADHIAQTIPDARYVLLKDCGHFAYLEAPDAVQQAIGDFFKE